MHAIERSEASMASFLENTEHKRRSKAWDYFVKTDTKKCFAECGLCKEVLSYSSTSANLMSHLKKKHNICRNQKSPNVEKVLESEYWEYFNRDEEEKKASCKLCSEDIDYEESSTAPLDHLKSKHLDSIELETVAEDDASNDGDDSGSDDNVLREFRNTRKPRNKYSVAWQYFDVEDDDKKLASCKMCGDIRSYRSTITNLMRHLKRKHGDNYESELAIKRERNGNETVAETDAEDNTDTTKPRPSSNVWLYFKIVDKRNKKSQCLICKKVISHSTTVTNLKQHIYRMHPHLNLSRKDDDTKTLLLSANGQLYEVDTDKNGDHNDDDDQNEPEEMDTVYLEDFDALDSQKQPKYSTPRKTEYKHKPKRKPLLSSITLHDSSSEDAMPLSNRTSDSIDLFGRYAASLLRELPKEIANKLQSDFISRIMDAQLTYESQKHVHALSQQAQAEGQSNAYSITVTTADTLEIKSPEDNVMTDLVQSEM